MKRSSIERIQDWYATQCDGEWEHGYGVKIETLDNPGWHISISLKGTSLETRTFEDVSFFAKGADDADDQDWFVMYVRHDDDSHGPVFKGYGGPKYFERLLEGFLEFAEP